MVACIESLYVQLLVNNSKKNDNGSVVNAHHRNKAKLYYMNYKFTSWLCEYLNAQSAHRK